MTNDELIISNTKLAYKLAHKYNRLFQGKIELDELYSISFLGLVKAANAFDTSKNLEFSTFAYTCIQNEILYFYRKNKKHNLDISLFSEISDDTVLQDVIPTSNNIDDDISLKSDINLLYKFIEYLPTKEKQVIEYRLQGMTMTEIGKLMGYSQPQISRLHARAINKLRDKFLV